MSPSWESGGALRRNRLDLDRKIAQVRKALEQIKPHGLCFKTAKPKAGRRDIGPIFGLSFEGRVTI